MTDVPEKQEKPRKKNRPTQDRALVRECERDRFKTAPKHRREVIAQGKRLSVSTTKKPLIN